MIESENEMWHQIGESLVKSFKSAEHNIISIYFEKDMNVSANGSAIASNM